MNKITVLNVQVVNNRLTIAFDCKGPIRKFFISNNFIAEYDTSIEKVPEAILIIPFLATICPIAWANQADVFVETVDATFLSSLALVRKALQNFYPKMTFRGNVHANNIVSPNVEARTKRMMLFSGGIDSLTTFIRHQKENPILVSVQETDFSVHRKNSQNIGRMKVSMNIASEYVETFSRTVKSENRIIRSNWIFIPDIFWLEVYQKKLSGDCYTRVMHGLAFSGLCSPLAYIENVDKLYIASSYTAEAQIPWGSHPDIDNNVKWSGTIVEHDWYELSRQDKMFVIASYIKDKYPRLQFLSCTNLWSRRKTGVNLGSNCGVCEKCSRTILGLELAGINPNEHGYPINAHTFSDIRKNLASRTWRFGDDEVFMWTDLKKHASNAQEITDYEVKLLVDWLKNVDVESLRVNPNRTRRMDPILKLLPYPIFRLTEKLYFMFNKILARVIKF